LALAPAAGTPQQRQAPHQNVTPNPALLAFWDKTGGQSMKLIVKNAKDLGNPVPNNDAGKAMCVTFHCIGTCNNNCSRRFNHNKLMKGKQSSCCVHNAAEDARLLAWCQAAFPGA
jgi:hypothetical protein